MKSKKLDDIFWYLILATFLCLTLTIQYLAKEGLIDVKNFYITDSYTYERRAFLELNVESFSAITYNFLNQNLYKIGSYSFFIFNSFLLFLSLNLCKDVFQNLSPQAVNYAKLAIVGNPYLLFGAIGPNKETILIFICLIYWKFFLIKKLRFKPLVLMLIMTLPLFIRPVVSFSLIFAFSFHNLISFLKKPKIIIFTILILFFILNSTSFGQDIIYGLRGEDIEHFQSSRIFQIAIFLEKMSKDTFLQFPAFIIKAFIILFGYIFRPLDIFNANPKIIDIGFSFLSYLYFPFNLSFVIVLLTKQNKHLITNYLDYDLLFFTSISTMIVILNPVITFRYLIPTSPFIFSFFSMQKLQTRSYILLISILCILSTLMISRFYFSLNESFIINSIDEPIPRFMDWL